MNFNIPKPQQEKLKKISEALDVSMAELIRKALDDLFENKYKDIIANGNSKSI